MLAQLIVGGSIVFVEWNDIFRIRLFQFEPQRMPVKPGVQQLLAELGPGFHGRAVADCFIRPSAALGNRRPLDLSEAKLPAVLAAARATRCRTQP